MEKLLLTREKFENPHMSLQQLLSRRMLKQFVQQGRSE